MKKILILGASGFIGKNLLRYFKNKYEVKAPTKQEIDALNEKVISHYLKQERFDVILNAIDIRTAGNQYFEDRMRIFMNLERSQDLYQKMIYFGSGAEYARELPIVNIREEEFNRKIPEDTYGFCLHQMSQFAIRSENIYNLRLFGIFGKYEIWQRRFISNAICKALYELPITIRQNTIFDYLYIDDLCRIVDWMMNHSPQYHDYNAVSGQRYELKTLAEMVRNITNKEVPLLIGMDGFGKEYSASNARLKKEIPDFKITPIEDSISELSQWYKQNLEVILKEELLD